MAKHCARKKKAPLEREAISAAWLWADKGRKVLAAISSNVFFYVTENALVFSSNPGWGLTRNSLAPL
jgi:hypothetical protein